MENGRSTCLKAVYHREKREQGVAQNPLGGSKSIWELKRDIKGGMEGLKVELKNTALQTTLEAIYMNHYTSAERRNAARAFLEEGRARQLLPRGKGSCGIRDERKGSGDCRLRVARQNSFSS
jgi:hypothetical protein